MFKALFVDDEIIVREGVERRVDWESHGFQLMGTLANGSQVVSYLEKDDDIQLVFSDISMPNMDGLELAKYLQEHHPHIYVLLLTGYDEFEYAREAIKYHVKELLLKPITAHEMGRVLDGVHQVLEGEQYRKLEQEELQRLATESRPLLRERFLNSLVKGNSSPDQLSQQLTVYDLPRMKGPCICIVLDPYPEGDQDDPQQYFMISLHELCRKHLQKQDILFQDKDDRPVYILQQESAQRLIDRSRLICSQIRQQLNQHYHASVSFGIGRVCSDFSEVHRSYRDALAALKHQFVLGKNRIISYDDISHDQSSLKEIRRDVEEELLDSLKTQPADASQQIVSRFFQETFSEHVNLRQAQLQTHLLFGTLLTFAEEAGIDPSRVIPSSQDGLVEVFSLRSREEVEQWFFQCIEQIHRQVSTSSLDVTEQKIRQAVAYIEEHYSLPQVNVQDVSRELHISPSHFSALFKRHTGKTFVEYLTGVRVRQASMLLKTTNLCAYEVSEAVGYEDSHYFSQVFKKVTGMTIREYRSMIGSSEEGGKG